VLIAEKLGVSQPTVSEHLKILSQAGLLSAKRVKQWTFYKRDEARIDKLKAAMLAKIRDQVDTTDRGRAASRCRSDAQTVPVRTTNPRSP
jgi:DNA-binding transcriptional ArsR family regulator